MARQADLVQVIRKAGRFTLLIDGEQFPWFVDVVETVLAEGAAPTLRLTLPAGRIEVVDEPSPAPPQALNAEPAAQPAG